jgi:hypothetical protein
MLKMVSWTCRLDWNLLGNSSGIYILFAFTCLFDIPFESWIALLCLVGLLGFRTIFIHWNTIIYFKKCLAKQKTFFPHFLSHSQPLPSVFMK